MAIIKCPECGQEMSASAACCPQCGMPMDVIHSVLAQQAAAAAPVETPASNEVPQQQQNVATVRCPECGQEMNASAECCPKCGMPMDVIQSVLAQQPAAVAPVETHASSGATQLQQNEASALAQQQLNGLRQEVNRLETAIATYKNEMSELEAERQNLSNELARERAAAKKNAGAQLQALQEEVARWQQQVDTLREDASTQQSIIDTLRAEAEQLNQQMAIAKQTLQQEPQSGKGYKIAVTLLCIAIAATLAWIIWMVVNTR